MQVMKTLLQWYLWNHEHIANLIGKAGKTTAFIKLSHSNCLYFKCALAMSDNKYDTLKCFLKDKELDVLIF